jgi:hypothetical protein
MKRRLTLACSFTVACAALVWPSPSLAASAGDFLDLEWIAPAECPGRGEVLADLERVVGELSSEPTRGRVRARIVLWRGAGADGPWRGVVTTFGDGAGERSLRAPSCRALADATELILALRVDPTLAARMAPPVSTIPEPRSTAATPPPSSGPAPAPPLSAPTPVTPAPAALPLASTPLPPAPAPLPPSAPTPLPSSAPATTTAPKPGPSPPHEATVAPLRLHQEFALGASILGELGTLPSPEVGGEVFASWLPGRWRAELREATGLVQNADVTGRSGVGASLRAFSGGARGCYAILPFSVSVAGCALTEVDWVWASGYATASATVRDANAGWVALGGGVLVVWRLSDRVSVRANVDSIAPLTRPRFVTEGPDGTFSGLVHRPSALIGRTGLGVELHFF